MFSVYPTRMCPSPLRLSGLSADGYPTFQRSSLAANVVLEMIGETFDIQSHFLISSTAGTLLGYGPFSIGGSYSSPATSVSSTFKATANGCRQVEIRECYVPGTRLALNLNRTIIKPPQIIGCASLSDRPSSPSCPHSLNPKRGQCSFWTRNDLRALAPQPFPSC